MKEELRKLYKEYEEECEKKTRENEYWYKPGVQEFWEWLLTGEITSASL